MSTIRVHKTVIGPGPTGDVLIELLIEREPDRQHDVEILARAQVIGKTRAQMLDVLKRLQKELDDTVEIPIFKEIPPSLDAKFGGS